MQIIRNYISRIELANDDNEVFTLHTRKLPAAEMTAGQSYLRVTNPLGEVYYHHVEGPKTLHVLELTEWYRDTHFALMPDAVNIQLVTAGQYGRRQVRPTEAANS